MCRNYNTKQGCLYGSTCRFEHTDKKASSLSEADGLTPSGYSVVCQYYNTKQGCRFGSTCRFEHIGETVDTAAISKSCGICFEKIHKFGLLLNCDHTFCFSCINSWRKNAKDKSNTKEELTARRSCPECRTKSDFVISSSTYAEGNEKKMLIQNILEKKKTLPCREWTNSKNCKFRGYCFYAHLDQKGEDCKEKQRAEDENRARHKKNQRDRRRRYNYSDYSEDSDDLDYDVDMLFEQIMNDFQGYLGFDPDDVF